MLIDLSHTIAHGIVTYPGLPSPIICDFLSRENSQSHYAEGVEFQIGQITMVANTGTYLDTPFHRYADGKDLSDLPLEHTVDLEGLRVHTSASAIGPEAFRGLSVAGKAVLVETGWSRHWGTDAYLSGHPFLTEEAAAWLKGEGARLVGIDSLNIDDIADKRRPVHSTLLGAEIPIVEHMTNLTTLPDSNFQFFAAPVKVKGFGTFPVRAFAILSGLPTR